jgi:hypothetical protein
MQRQTAPDSQSSLVELKVDITGPPLERDVYTAQVMAQVATGEVGERRTSSGFPCGPGRSRSSPTRRS